MNKLTSSVVGLFILAPAFCATSASFDGTVDMSDCPSVTLRVDDVSTATGWGSHFSIGQFENGYGGANFECHLNTNRDLLVALCYDGVLGHASGSDSTTNRTNQFYAFLGKQTDIDFVEWHVGENGVTVMAQVLSKSPYTSKHIPYQENAFFPIHPDIGACGVDNFDTGQTLYWIADGVLGGVAGRNGSGYSMTVTTP